MKIKINFSETSISVRFSALFRPFSISPVPPSQFQNLLSSSPENGQPDPKLPPYKKGFCHKLLNQLEGKLGGGAGKYVAKQVVCSENKRRQNRQGY